MINITRQATSRLIYGLRLNPLSALFTRQWHNRVDQSNHQQRAGVSTVEDSATLVSKNFSASPLTELDYQLDEIKVFQDEQIIQLQFKSGKSINYTMTWMRNLCSCSDCLNSKLRLQPRETESQPTFLVEGKLSIIRTRCISESELEIEWLDTKYKRHSSRYNLKYLNIYAAY